MKKRRNEFRDVELGEWGADAIFGVIDLLRCLNSARKMIRNGALEEGDYDAKKSEQETVEHAKQRLFDVIGHAIESGDEAALERILPALRYHKKHSLHTSGMLGFFKPPEKQNKVRAVCYVYFKDCCEQEIQPGWVDLRELLKNQGFAEQTDRVLLMYATEFGIKLRRAPAGRKPNAKKNTGTRERKQRS